MRLHVLQVLKRSKLAGPLSERDHTLSPSGGLSFLNPAEEVHRYVRSHTKLYWKETDATVPQSALESDYIYLR